MCLVASSASCRNRSYIRESSGWLSSESSWIFIRAVSPHVGSRLTKYTKLDPWLVVTVPSLLMTKVRSLSCGTWIALAAWVLTWLSWNIGLSYRHVWLRLDCKLDTALEEILSSIPSIQSSDCVLGPSASVQSVSTPLSPLTLDSNDSCYCPLPQPLISLSKALHKLA